MRHISNSRRLALGLVALLASVALVSMPLPARAASAPTASSVTSATSIATVMPAAGETSKIVLNETSVDGPAFWTNVPIGEPGAGANNILAWTGTDAAHHLNTLQVSLTSSGYRLAGKQTLNETSFARPAVTVQPSQLHPTYYFLAWTGTNAAHSLNVICDGCASRRIKLTLWNETSFAAPAVAMLNGKLMLAWAGTDAHHSLNILDIGIDNGQFVIGHKTTLSQFSSVTGPGLVYQPDNALGKGILLTWAATPAGQINAALSSTGTDWPRAGYFVYPEWRVAAPNILSLVPLVTMPHQYLAWTGKDSAHSLNLLFPAYPPPLNATKLTLRETALGGPALGYIGSPATILLSWTGTDRLHHLNLATIGV